MKHLLTLWNPAYADDPMEAHLRLLLDWDQRARSGEVDEDEVYLWWGKVRSVHRLQPMPHLEEVLSIGDALGSADADVELHLYLTDYRSLYVADVEYVTSEDPRMSDAAHVPSYYASSRLSCDCWFRLRDIRAVVRGDLEGVASELARLRNTRYHDKAVSLYGGMVDLPLIVTRSDNRRFFQDSERDLLAEGQLWARFDAEQGGVGAIEASLRDDHFGEHAWHKLDAAARRFIAMAERTLRENRADPAADLSPVVIGYAKSLEVQVNQLLRESLKKAPGDARLTNVNGRTVDVLDSVPLPLGTLSRVLGGERVLQEYLTKTLSDGAWCTYELAALLDAVADVRNPAAHGEQVSRRRVIELRNRLLGVGCESALCRLALVGAK